MTLSFRGMIDDLRQAGQIKDIEKPVDIRHIAALVDKAGKALIFHNVIDYAMPVVSSIATARAHRGGLRLRLWRGLQAHRGGAERAHRARRSQ